MSAPLVNLPPYIIAVAPTGARRMPVEVPGLPMTVQEIAREAEACCDAGAALLHLHVRDDQGRHSLDPDLYRDAIAAVRERIGDRMIVQITTEAAGVFDRDTQIASVRAVQPEAVSLAWREFAPDGQVDGAFKALLTDLAAAHCMVQFIVYGPDDLSVLLARRAVGEVPGRVLSVLFVLGRYGQEGVTAPTDLLPFLEVWRRRDGDADAQWMACAFGMAEVAVAAAGAALDGHMRVGFENNTARAGGEAAVGNAELVDQAVRAGALCGRVPATAAQARNLYKRL